MEVDRAVLLGRMAEVGLVAVVVVAGDAARRHVDQAAVARVHGERSVTRSGRDVGGEVPSPDEIVAERGKVIGPRLERAAPPRR